MTKLKNKEDKKVKLTITVSPDVIRNFKIKCEKNNQCVSKVVNSWMVNDLKKELKALTKTYIND
jgi:hypothetical protein